MNRRKKRIKFAFLLVILLISALLARRIYGSRKESLKVPQNIASAQEIRPEVKKTEVAVESGDIWSKVCAKSGLESSECSGIYAATKGVYDLATIRAGKTFAFYAEEGGAINKAIYAPDTERELVVDRNEADGSWRAKIQNIVYDIREKTVEGTINSSLYEAALKAGADEGAVVEFAESMDWSIDFANDPRVGDKFKFLYEERYRDGKYVMPGRVLAGAYENAGTLIQSFYFEENADNKGYFDENGNSVQKMFLKAPLAFKYISSPFTTGKRYVEAFNVSTGHRAIDYAAAYGTPIRAVGDGTVTHAGWSSAGYGNLTSIRHNGTYSTNYGHQSKIIVKVGERVSQGQVIGYVGSTGFSTGPHLHFEMVKNGVKINPMREILPPGKPIGDARKADFQKLVEEMKAKIKI